MAKWGDVDFRQLKELQERINNMLSFDKDAFCQDVARELAQRLYRKVVKRTPTGDYEPITYTKKDCTEITYNENKKGGTLKKGWAVKSVTRDGNSYVCEVINPVEYASYFEYGHRQQPGRFVPQIGKRLKSGWAEGKFVLTISEKEIQSIAPKLIEKRLQEKLREMMNDQ